MQHSRRTSVRERVQEVIRVVRREWPQLHVAESAFLAHLAQPAYRDCPARHLPDLCFAFACTKGAAACVQAFDARFASALQRKIAQASAERSFVDETYHLLQQRLLLGPAPGLLKYTGRSPLGGWLAVVAAHLAVDGLRARQRERQRELPLPEALALVDSDIEGKLDRARHAGRIEQLLRAALAAMSSDDRDLLRLYYVESFTLDRLAPLLGQHRATIARKLARLRDSLRAQLEAGERGLSASELRTLLSLLAQRVQLWSTHASTRLEPS